MRWEPHPTMAIEEIALSVGRWGTEANQTLDGRKRGCEAATGDDCDDGASAEGPG
jgi:hypothetical protein